MNRIDDGAQAVKIANPKTLEFQVVRTSLLPGLLKTMRENRSHALPIQIFETSDVVFKDKSLERQARNERHAAALWCNKTAGFEMVHGLLDSIMQMLEVPRISGSDAESLHGYYIKERDGNVISLLVKTDFMLIILYEDATFFPGRGATIYYRSQPDTPGSLLTSLKRTLSIGRDWEIGVLGILHPSVLEKFEIGYPCSALEFNLEPFKKEVKAVWVNP